MKFSEIEISDKLWQVLQESKDPRFCSRDQRNDIPISVLIEEERKLQGSSNYSDKELLQLAANRLELDHVML